MYVAVQWPRVCFRGFAVLLASLATGPGIPQTRAPGEVFAEAQSLRLRGGPANLRQAVQKYQEAQALYRAAHDDRGLANAFYWAGRAYDSLSDKRNGLASFEQALPLFRALGDRSAEAQSLIYMALDYVYLGQAAKARGAVSEALAAGASAAPEAKATVFTHAGNVANQLGDRGQAIEYFEQALPLQRGLRSRQGEASTLSGMGVVYYGMGQAQKALECLRPALELYRGLGDLRDEAYTRTSIGAVYFSQDDYPQALRYFEEALPQWERAGDRSGLSATLHNAAAAHERLGHLENAIRLYGQALELHRAAEYRVGEANTCSNLGRLHTLLGDYTTALGYYNRALPLHRASGNPGLEAATLSSIGVVYDLLGDNRKALELYREALPLRRKASDRAGEADTLTRLAVSYAALGEKDKTAEFANQALELYRAAGSRRGEAGALGMLAAAASDAERAAGHRRSALELYRAIGDRPGEAETLFRIARLEAERGHLREARREAEAALELAESLRTRVLSPELRASYVASIRDYFDLEIDVLMRLDREQPSAGFAAAAFETQERSRARSLLDMLSEAGVDIREGVAAELLERERGLKQALNAKADRHAELAAGKRTAQQIAAAEAELALLAGELRLVQSEIRDASPHYAGLTQPRPLGLAEIQREVLDEGTLLVQYALGPERSHAWVVSADSVEAFVLAPRREIEAAARRFVELAGGEDPRAAAAAGALSRLILAPLASRLGTKRLAVVEDGALAYVPFAALPAPGSADGHPLLQDHELVSLPSASTLAALRRETALRKPAAKALAVLADPVFRQEDARVGKSGPAAAGTAARTAERSLARLEGSRKEAEAILSLVPAAERRQAVDFDANLAAATSADLAGYRAVHLATHAFLDTERPELSSIVLSLVDAQGRPRDGILRLHDIYNLRWQADLVTLSACQTALGKAIRGEGLIGLARGFMYAGVPRVAASLWKVDDRATAELMRRFYEAMLTRRLPAAAALRAAQLGMMRQQKWRLPYYWAAFVLQGDWR